jgi:hypothetical protein
VELIPRLIAKVHFNGLKLSCSQLLVLFRGLDLLARDFESLAGDWGGARYESTLLEKLRSLGIWRAIACAVLQLDAAAGAVKMYVTTPIGDNESSRYIPYRYTIGVRYIKGKTYEPNSGETLSN